MAKKKGYSNATQPWEVELSNMKYKDLKMACISRGMDFNEVVEGDYNNLHSFFRINYYVKKNIELINLFDKWMDDQLEQRGYDADDPIRKFRISTTLEENEEGEMESKIKVKQLKKAFLKKDKKPKKEKDSSTGIFKGTKKAYTYELTQQGKDLKSIIQEVILKFPDASAKSIGIWHSRRKKELANKSK